MFIGRNDAEAETPMLWPPDAKSWLIGKDPDAGRDWGQEEKGTTEDEMAGWYHWLDAHEFGWTPGVGDGQGGLVCCVSWGHKESDMTERLNWTELICSSAINTQIYPGFLRIKKLLLTVYHLAQDSRYFRKHKGFLGGLMIKYLPAMQETWVQSLVREDPLKKEMATHSSILAWRISWTEEPGGL